MSAAADTPAVADDLAQLRSLALSLNCMTEPDFALLADATLKTVETWRKRGTGPAYILLGNRYLYPRDAVADFIKQLVRQPRKAIKVTELL